MAQIERGATNNWAFVGPVALVFHTDGKLDDARWDIFISELRNHDTTHLLGGAWGAASLTSLQRGQLNDALNGIPAAVVVNHSVARGILTAMSWLGVKVKPFPWPQIKEAATYLALPPTLTEMVITQFTELIQSSLPSDHPGLEKF